MINKLRAADEEKMLRDLRRLSRKGRDLEFRGQNGETPVTARRLDIYVTSSYCYFHVMVGKTESRFDLNRDFSVLAIPFQSINGLLHIAAKCWINTFRYNTSCARGNTI